MRLLILHRVGLGVALAALALTACTNVAQTSSGADYLSRYEAVSRRDTAGPSLDEAIRVAADVEPLLTFPARFGLARIANGRLTAIPAAEQEIWQKLATDWSAVGEFVPVSPLIVATTSDIPYCGSNYGCPDRLGELVKSIRTGAARQHVHAVLIYEVGVRSSKEASGLGFMDLTIIGGAFLPTRRIQAAGVAQAVLIDVWNGYPYGQAVAQRSLDELTRSWGSDARTEAKREQVALMAVEALMPELDQMMRGLVTGLAARGPGSKAGHQEE